MLLTLKKTHRKDAIDLFKLVQMCMGDRKSRHTGTQVALTIVSKCWAITQLRDELYLQLCKQTTEAPNMCVRVSRCLYPWCSFRSSLLSTGSSPVCCLPRGLAIVASASRALQEKPRERMGVALHRHHVLPSIEQVLLVS